MKNYSLFILTFFVLTLVTTIAAALDESAVKEYFSGWNNGDVNKIMSYFAKDIVYEDVPKGETATGRSEVKAFVQKFVSENPDVKLVLDSTTIGTAGAAAEWTMSGGVGDQAWSVRGASIMVHTEGKFSRVTDYWDK